MKLRPTVLVFLLFLISPVSSGDDLDRSVELYWKSHSVLVETTRHLIENVNLGWASAQGEIGPDYAITEQTKNLLLAKSKFEEFDRLLERYSSLKVTDRFAVKHKSTMLEYLYSSRPVLIEMITEGEAILSATESQDIDGLSRASINLQWQNILQMEGENALISTTNYRLSTWEPVLWLNLCQVAANKTQIDFNEAVIGVIVGYSQDDVLQLLDSAERNLRTYRRQITVGREKTRGLVAYAEEHPEIMETYGTLTDIAERADTYIASFDNESIMADAQEEMIEFEKKLVIEKNIPRDELVRMFQSFELKQKLILKRRYELAAERAERFGN